MRNPSVSHFRINLTIAASLFVLFFVSLLMQQIQWSPQFRGRVFELRVWHGVAALVYFVQLAASFGLCLSQRPSEFSSIYFIPVFMFTGFFGSLHAVTADYSVSNRLVYQFCVERWLEYAAGFSFMMVLLAIQVGANRASDLVIIILTTVLYVALCYHIERRWGKWKFIISNVIGHIAWVIIGVKMVINFNDQFVYVIVAYFATLFVFFFFPVILYKRYQPYERADTRFLLFSLVSKTVLAWTILIGFVLDD